MSRIQTRKQRRQLIQETENILNKKFALKKISPMTMNQEKMIQQFENGNHIAAVGSAGTGKTYLALSLAFKSVFEEEAYDKVIIVRSAVQSREQGFMPGSLTEKMAYYETPYIDIATNLFGRPDAYNILKQKGQIEFMSTSFIRGLTFDNAIIIIDECQNMHYQELRTVITRLGTDSKLILCGDVKQDDLKTSKNRLDCSGLTQFLRVVKEIPDFKTVTFTTDDIVRSGFVKNFIIEEEKVLEAA